MTYSADKASVMPAVSQRLEEAVARINLEVTAVAFGTKHLFIVCRERQTNRKGPISTEWSKCLLGVRQFKKEKDIKGITLT